jgi:rod shape-determining protein MreD
MRRAFFVLLVVLCFVLESRVSLAGVSPALTLLPVYYVGLKQGSTRGLLFGALIGAIGDSLSGNILGPNMLGKGTAGFLASFMRGGLFRWTPLLGVIGVAVLTVFDGVVAFGATAAFAGTPAPLSDAAFRVLGQAAINAVAGIYIRPEDEI